MKWSVIYARENNSPIFEENLDIQLDGLSFLARFAILSWCGVQVLSVDLSFLGGHDEMSFSHKYKTHTSLSCSHVGEVNGICVAVICSWDYFLFSIKRNSLCLQTSAVLQHKKKHSLPFHFLGLAFRNPSTSLTSPGAPFVSTKAKE